MLRNMSPSAASILRHAASAVLLSSLAAGCAYGEMPQVLRAQVATEASCPEVVVQQAPPYSAEQNENQFTVRGCGIDRVYTCKGDTSGLVKFGSADCSYVARGAPAQGAAPAPPAPAPAGEPELESEPGLEDDSNG